MRLSRLVHEASVQAFLASVVPHTCRHDKQTVSPSNSSNGQGRAPPAESKSEISDPHHSEDSASSSCSLDSLEGGGEARQGSGALPHDDAWEIVQDGTQLNDFRGSQLRSAELQPESSGPATLRNSAFLLDQNYQLHLEAVWRCLNHELVAHRFFLDQNL